MPNLYRSIASVALLLVTAAAPPVGATSFTLDDIDFWVGEGENRAAIAIDWNGDDESLAVAAPSLVWGYRWDGSATADEALRDTLAADPRLFGRLTTFDGFGTAVLGLGYDANDDGQFGIEPDPLLEVFLMEQIVETFDAATGLADSTSLSFAGPADPADAYDEGFESNPVNGGNSGFWLLSTAGGGVAEDFAASPAGVSSLMLEEGLFVGLSFTPIFNFAAFPNNLVAAEPPGVGLLQGDANGDSIVNAADYAVLRDTLGDAEAFAEFQANFGAVGVTTAAAAVPEPSAGGCLLLICWCGAAGRGAGRPEMF